MSQKKELTPRQEAFCREYVVNPIGTYAAIDAGYEPKNARIQASRLLTKSNIQERVNALRTEIAARCGATAEAHFVKLEAIFHKAYENHQFHAAVRAVEAQARLAGSMAGSMAGSLAGNPVGREIRQKAATGRESAGEVGDPTQPQPGLDEPDRKAEASFAGPRLAVLPPAGK